MMIVSTFNHSMWLISSGIYEISQSDNIVPSFYRKNNCVKKNDCIYERNLQKNKLGDFYRKRRSRNGAFEGIREGDG